MFKKTSIICLIVLAGIFLAAGFGCAKKKPERFEEKLGQMIDKISSSLDLTESQKLTTAVIKEEILKNNAEKKKALPAEMKEMEAAFTKQIEGEKFNEKELNKIMDAQAAKKEEMRRFMIGQLAKFHAILTPAQRKKLTEILKELGPGRRSGPRREHGRKEVTAERPEPNK